MQLIWIVFLFVYYYYGMIRVIKCCTMLLLRQVVLNCSKLFWLELDDRCDHVNVLHFSVGVGHGIFPCPWILFFPFKVALLNKTWKAKISITLPKNICIHLCQFDVKIFISYWDFYTGSNWPKNSLKNIRNFQRAKLFRDV